LHPQRFLVVRYGAARGLQGLDELQGFLNFFGSFVFKENFYRLLVEAIGVKVPDDDLAEPPYAAAYRLQGKLPEEMLLEGLGTGEGPFDKAALFVGRLLSPPVYEARIGTYLKVFLFFFPGLDSLVQGYGGVIFQDLQGGVFFQFFLYLFPQIYDWELHQLDRLIELRVHFETLFLEE
jgi:hypothetical protein